MSEFVSIRKICVGLLMIFTIFSFSCQRDKSIVDFESSDMEDIFVLQRDQYEPNETRKEAVDLDRLPFDGLEGTLLDRDDVDWFRFNVEDPDSCTIKFMLTEMSTFFGIKIGFYNDSETPKGVVYAYNGVPPENHGVNFSWDVVSGDHFFYVRADTSYEKEMGKYSFDIVKLDK